MGSFKIRLEVRGGISLNFDRSGGESYVQEQKFVMDAPPKDRIDRSSFLLEVASWN